VIVCEVDAIKGPEAVMDLSFADVTLTARYLVEQGPMLAPGVHSVPPEIDA
jgi:S-adenosylhomocysteine hydrolase